MQDFRAPNTAPVDAARYRHVLGHFATGVTVVTAIEPGAGQPLGITINSFTSVSLDPPMILFCVRNSSCSWPPMRTARHLCVNILSYADRSIGQQMAAPAEHERFRNVRWMPSPCGAPVLSSAVAWLDGTVRTEVSAGDHVIVVVEVHHFDAHGEEPPLVFLRGRYGRFAG